MSRTPTVSFVVIAHNEERGIGQTLRSILDQDALADDRELIVVDDGSTDATARIVDDMSRADPELRLVRLDRNRGRGFARATAISEATGRLIATVDADIVLPPDWLARCLEAIASVDAVAGTTVPDGDVAYLHSRCGLQPRVRPHRAAITGSNALYRRELFEHVGFEPALTEGEDVALSHAMRRHAAKTLTVVGLLVRHEEHKTLGQALGWMLQSGRGATRQLYRYREPRQPDLVFAGWLAAWGVGWRLRHRLEVTGTMLPLAYLAAAAAAHVRGAFFVRRGNVGALLAAVGLDMAFLGAYFAGRTAGAFGLVGLGDR